MPSAPLGMIQPCRMSAFISVPLPSLLCLETATLSAVLRHLKSISRWGDPKHRTEIIDFVAKESLRAPRVFSKVS